MDPKQREKVIVLALLGLVIVGVLWFQFFRGPSMSAPANAVANAPAKAIPAQIAAVAGSVFQEVDFNIEELVQSIKEVDFDYMEARLARDPMAPLLAGAAFLRPQARYAHSGTSSMSDSVVYEANRKTVTGIIWDETDPVAVIREPGLPERIVYAGDRLGAGIVIKAVEQNHVVFAITVDGEEMEIIKELAKEQ